MALPNPLYNSLTHVLPEVEIRYKKFDPDTYRGQGQGIIRKTSPYISHVGEAIIILVEGCGSVSQNNYSGFRRADGEYYEFDSPEQWGRMFRRVMDKRYSKRKNETVEQWLDRISYRYNPEHREEWLERCGYWLNKLT